MILCAIHVLITFVISSALIIRLYAYPNYAAAIFPLRFTESVAFRKLKRAGVNPARYRYRV